MKGVSIPGAKLLHKLQPEEQVLPRINSYADL